MLSFISRSGKISEIASEILPSDLSFSEIGCKSKHVNKEAQLPPFPQLVEASFENYMKQASNPVLVRARIWAWAPEELKTEVWDQLTETFADHCKATGLDVSRAFPKPAGVTTNNATGPAANNGENQSRDAAATQARDPA